MARAVTTNRKIINTAAAWAIGLADLLPDPLDDPDQLQDRSDGHRRSAGLPVLRLDHRELRRRAWSARTTCALPGTRSSSPAARPFSA